MKKLLIALLVIGAVIAVIIYINGKNRNIDLDSVFDEKPPEVSGDVTSDVSASSNSKPNVPTDTENGDNNIPSVSAPEDTKDNQAEKAESTDTEADKSGNKKPGENDITGTDKDAAKDDIPIAENNGASEPEEKDSVTVFELTDAEKQSIIGRYIDAEGFYYSMLYQQFDLDSYDVIIRENDDGYNTEYHRVLYYDVNSKADLREHYLAYFTSDFVSKLDMSSYIEENDKLYCAEVSNASSSKGTKYTYTVESTDENNAVVIRTLTNGRGKQRIKAVKRNGTWYFASVAIN